MTAATAAEPSMLAGERGWSLNPLRNALSFRRVSAIYIWIAMVVLFSLWIPDTFLTATTLKSVLSQESVTALLAVGLVVPLAAGVYDLSIGLVLGAASVNVAYFQANTGLSATSSVILTALIGIGIGIVNGVLVVRFRINSFIATLGTTSVLSAYVLWLSDNQQIIGLDEGFRRWATNETFGVAWSTLFLLLVATVVWFALQHRPAGRYLYATGGSPEAARLAGVRTDRVVFGALVISSFVATLAGIVTTSRVGTGSPSIGPPFLLPAFAAAFLGSTQLKPGRFNVWGAVLAVFVLATGVKGLQLAGAPFWLKDLFNGVALVLAVGLAGTQQRRVPTAAATHVDADVAGPSTSPDALASRGAERLAEATGELVRALRESDAGWQVMAAIPAARPVGVTWGAADHHIEQDHPIGSFLRETVEEPTVRELASGEVTAIAAVAGQVDGARIVLMVETPTVLLDDSRQVNLVRQLGHHAAALRIDLEQEGITQ